jgi:hypothetical protein
VLCQSSGFLFWCVFIGGLDKKEFREVGYRTPGVLAAENGSLIISRVTEDHEAHYICLANNGVGPGLSKLIRLTVNGKFSCFHHKNLHKKTAFTPGINYRR